MPGSPRNTNVPLLPFRASASTRSIRAHSTRRPISFTAQRYSRARTIDRSRALRLPVGGPCTRGTKTTAAMLAGRDDRLPAGAAKPKHPTSPPETHAVMYVFRGVVAVAPGAGAPVAPDADQRR